MERESLLASNKYRNYYKSEGETRKPIPIKHYWYGFDNCSGLERHFIELDDGKIISDKNDEYHYLIKKYFPND